MTHLPLLTPNCNTYYPKTKNSILSPILVITKAYAQRIYKQSEFARLFEKLLYLAGV